MYVVVLIAFVVALTLGEQAPLWSTRWLVAPALGMYLAGTVAVGALKTALSLRAIAREAHVPARVLRRHNLLNVLGQCWLVAGLAGVMLAGYGRWVLDDLRMGSIPLAGQLALLVPFLVALLLSWLLEYPFYREVRVRIARERTLAGEVARPGWTLGEYLGYNLRHHVLFVAVPVALILLAMDLLLLLHPSLPPRLADPAVVAAGAFWAGGVFLCAPLLIVRIWRTQRLPDGPLRDVLLRTCRKMNLKCRELLVWRTGGMITNAGVMGLLAPVRYVLLSDALLEHMDDREVRTIFAHEAGHIVSHHLFYSMMFAVSAALLCEAAGTTLAAALRLEAWAAEAVTIALLAAAWGAGFGWLSRRFERQSDVIAAWASGPGADDADGDRVTPEGAALFARSLEHVGQLNGIPPRQRNWRHGSIAGRVRYVLWLGSTAGTRRDINRLVRRIKIGLWVALAAAGSVTAARLLLAS
jgi:hypothetical protein